MKNKTSNEDIRHRWNGHHRNNKASKFFKKDAGYCRRLGYILCGNMEKHHGRSKLELYAEFVELSRQLEESEQKLRLREMSEDE